MVIGPDELDRLFEQSVQLAEWQRRVCRAIDESAARHFATSAHLAPAGTPFEEMQRQVAGFRPLIEIEDEIDAMGGELAGRHRFKQNPDYETQVCEHCGMWPIYHTHIGSYGCNCAACDPEGYRWEGYAVVPPGLGDDAMHTRGAHQTFRPHP